MTPPCLAIVLKGYPRLSETFIAQEIEGLEARGAHLVLWSLRRPTDTLTHPVHSRIKARVHYLPEYLHQEPWRVLRGLAHGVIRTGFLNTLRAFLRDLIADPSLNRIRRFGQALVLARELGPAITHLHAHFLHTPSSVTRYTALLRGLPWSASAHAVDIWTAPPAELSLKLSEARFCVVCTRTGQDHLRSIASGSDRSRIHLVYHGLDLGRMPAAPSGRPRTDGRDATAPVRLITVARAVPKKGLDRLLEALAALPADLHWTWSHVGGGPELATLKTKAQHLGLEARVRWLGAAAQSDVFKALRLADCFVLPVRIAADGNRDGLPNALLEAMALALPCIATNLSAIPEAIEHGQDGWLIPPDDKDALTEALVRLITEPDLRLCLGQGAYDRVRRGFAMDPGIDRIADLLSIKRPSDS